MLRREEPVQMPRLRWELGPRKKEALGKEVSVEPNFDLRNQIKTSLAEQQPFCRNYSVDTPAGHCLETTAHSAICALIPFSRWTVLCGG